MATIAQILTTEVIPIWNFRSGKPPFFMGCFFAGIRQNNCGGISRFPQRSWRNGTAMRSGSLSYAIYLRGCWITAGMCWPFSIPWSDPTADRTIAVVPSLN